MSETRSADNQPIHVSHISQSKFVLQNWLAQTILGYDVWIRQQGKHVHSSQP